MLVSDNSFKSNRVHISKVEVGVTLVNLGILLEIEEHPRHYCLVIGRLNEKQLMKFDKDVLLAIE